MGCKLQNIIIPLDIVPICNELSFTFISVSPQEWRLANATIVSAHATARVSSNLFRSYRRRRRCLRCHDLPKSANPVYVSSVPDVLCSL